MSDINKGQPFEPHHPVIFTKPEIKAIQCLSVGNASESQQKKVLECIINKVCKTYDLPFFPHDASGRSDAFACGKKFVGQQIIKAIKTTLS